MKRLWCLPVAVAVACCSPDSSAPPSDAEVGADVADTAPDSPPIDESCPAGANADGICLPLSPQLTDWACPEGWLAVPALLDGEGVDLSDGLVEPFDICEPPELPGDCPDGTMPRVGSSACEPVGSECPPAGERWPAEDVLRARAPEHGGRLLYVDPEAGLGGIGSREAPFASVGDAVAAASAGDVVALAPADYPTPLVLDRDLALLGACPEATRLIAEGGSEPSLAVEADGALVGDLTVTGPRPGVRVTGAAVTATLRSLVIDGAADAAVSVEAGTGRVALDRVLVRHVVVGEGGGDGAGVVVVGGAAELRAVTVLDASGLGIGALGGELVLRDVLVADTRLERSSVWFGIGLVVLGGPGTDVERAVLTRNRSAGILAAGRVELDLSDVLVSDTLPDFTGSAGYGLDVEPGPEGGPTAHVARTQLRANRGSGIAVTGAASRVSAVDVIVADTELDDALGDGFGAGVFDGGELELERAVLLRNAGAALVDQEALLELRDALVADTRPGTWVGRFGAGLSVDFAGTATVERALILRSEDVGILALRDGTTVAITDVQVLHTQPRVDGHFGRALEVGRGAHGTAQRCVFRGAYDVGVLSGMTGSFLEADQIVIADVRSEPGGNSGVGLLVFDYADLRIGHFTVEQSALVGLQVARYGYVEGNDGAIRENPIGINLQQTAFDLDESFVRVRLEMNELDVDTSALAVPSLSDL